MEYGDRRRLRWHKTMFNGLTLILSGVVQGVGFRPFVHRLAHELGLGGWTQNRSGTVWIELEGEAGALAEFTQRVITDAPPLASPKIVRRETREIQVARSGFAILASVTEENADIHLPPDTHLCADCRRELFNPEDRRYRYPFINCTQCGPRYSLIAALPYDRVRTSMRDFPLCPDCQAEYENPSSRRFHAEPIACPVCGPKLSWYRPISDEHTTGEAALQSALHALRTGQILAVRGVGGYHLMCDARNAQALANLRQRKARPARPFAILCDETGDDGGEALRAWLTPSQAELCLLRSPQRPIVLLARRQDSKLPEALAPGLGHIGVMLPHSPLQALLAREFGAPLVASSGNLSGEPIALEPGEAERRLGSIADAFLHHDRTILRPSEDSVWQVFPHSGEAAPIRLGRGNAPQEWRLARPLAVPTLALGGEQKVCIALGWGNQAVVSPHIGDLAHPESLIWLERLVADFCRLYQVTPQRIVIDAHPGYQSRQWALRQEKPITEIWHHHAHASALSAGFPEVSDWLTLSWDGVGLGPDGSLWGGEFLRGSPGRWQRVARLRPFRLPGGEAASREIWRSAAGLLWEAGLSVPAWHPQIHLLHQAWQKGLNSPPSSAIGRLFDASAVLLGLCHQTSFEGEGPMRLQALAQTARDGPRWPIVWERKGDLWQLDWQPWLAGLQDKQIAPAQRAWALHDALARAVMTLLEKLALPTSTALGASGGVFQNSLLIERLHVRGLNLKLPRRHPANDGGLALGQLVELGND